MRVGILEYLHKEHLLDDYLFDLSGNVGYSVIYDDIVKNPEYFLSGTLLWSKCTSGADWYTHHSKITNIFNGYTCDEMYVDFTRKDLNEMITGTYKYIGTYYRLIPIKDTKGVHRL